LSVSVAGDVTIEGKGDLANQGSILVVGGNFTNNGTYTESTFLSNNTNYIPTIEFTGRNKTVGGNGTNEFNNATISGDITLTAGITIKPLTTTLSKFDVSGT